MQPSITAVLLSSTRFSVNRQRESNVTFKYDWYFPLKSILNKKVHLSVNQRRGILSYSEKKDRILDHLKKTGDQLSWLI